MIEIRVPAIAFENIRVKRFMGYLVDVGKMEPVEARTFVEAILSGKIMEIRGKYLADVQGHVHEIGRLRSALREKYDKVLDIFERPVREAGSELPAELQPEAFREIFNQLAAETEALKRQGEPEAHASGLSDAEMSEKPSSLAGTDAEAAEQLLRDTTLSDRPEAPRLAVASLTSLNEARLAGIPDLLLADGTVVTRADVPNAIPDSARSFGIPAPERLATTPELLGNEPVRRVANYRPGETPVQDIEVMADIRLLLDAGARPDSIRVNQMQVIDDLRVGTNRPDVTAELNGRQVHIEYDRAPGTRAWAHAERILANDPNAIVILKIVDF